MASTLKGHKGDASDDCLFDPDLPANALDGDGSSDGWSVDTESDKDETSVTMQEAELPEGHSDMITSTGDFVSEPAAEVEDQHALEARIRADPNFGRPARRYRRMMKSSLKRVAFDNAYLQGLKDHEIDDILPETDTGGNYVLVSDDRGTVEPFGRRRYRDVRTGDILEHRDAYSHLEPGEVPVKVVTGKRLDRLRKRATEALARASVA